MEQKSGPSETSYREAWGFKGSRNGMTDEVVGRKNTIFAVTDGQLTRAGWQQCVISKHAGTQYTWVKPAEGEQVQLTFMSTGTSGMIANMLWQNWIDTACE